MFVLKLSAYSFLAYALYTFAIPIIFTLKENAHHIDSAMKMIGG